MMAKAIKITKTVTPASLCYHHRVNDNFDRIILLDKPTGISSFGCVARVRKYLTTQAGHKVKVGHCGTLDPFATGLLILVSGKYTKRAGEFSHLDKEYLATIKLGANSSTGDPEGETMSINDRQPSENEIKNALRKFTGEIEQTPPRFSAIKVNGQRAYKLARAGKEVTMPTRRVTIYRIELVSYQYPELVIKTKVSSGTYIRSLAEDIGKELQTGAYTTALRRLSIGEYSLANAQPLTDYELENR